MRRIIVTILFLIYLIWVGIVSWNAVYNQFASVLEILFFTFVSFVISQAVALSTPWPQAIKPISIVIGLIQIGLVLAYAAMKVDFLAACAILNPIFHGGILSVFVRYFLYRRNVYKSIVIKDKRKIEGFGS